MPDILTEDLGLAKIHLVCAGMSAIWRPTPNHDLGIDGQIEFLELETVVSTGVILAVQSKSGSSYFGRQAGDAVLYYPTEKHRAYWSRIQLPVILVLYNPEDDVLIFTSVKPQLRKGGPLRVSTTSVFAMSSRDELLRMAREGTDIFSPADALEKFSAIKLERDGGRVISGIEFLLAAVSRNGDYFSLRMCRMSAVFDLLSSERMFGIGASDYEYIFRCCLEVEGLTLADTFISEFNEVWFGMEMVPDLEVPLTQRGLELVRYLWEHLDEYVSVEAFKHLGYLEAERIANEIADFAQSESDRLDRSDSIGMVPR
jgi:hypothetical protein